MSSSRDDRIPAPSSAWRFRIFLVAGSLLLALAAAEIGLRLAGLPRVLQPHSFPAQFRFLADGGDGKVRYVNEPSAAIRFVYDSNPRGYFDPDHAIEHPTNALGFRGPDWRIGLDEQGQVIPNKPEGLLRIAFLGDSFTFGEGVRFEDTYAARTGMRLRSDDVLNIEVLNFGVGGYNTAQSLEILENLALPALPDAVVLGYVLNDAEPPLFEKDTETGKPRRVPRAIDEFATTEAGDAALRLLQLFDQRRAERRRSEQTVAYYRSLYAADHPGWHESRTALQQIAARCREKQVPCVVVLFPMLYRLDGRYPYRDIHEQVGQIAREAGAEVIDLLPLLEGRKAAELWVHPTDHHPNEIVHGIAAKAVVRVLEERLR